MTVAWVFILIGVIVAIGAVALLVRALFHDRARGRRRCPKCWYDLSGSPSLVSAEAVALATGVTCSECGFKAKSQRCLLKTRRRWGQALIAVLLVLLAGGLAVTPIVQSGEWPRYVPSEVLVRLAPMLEQYPNSDLADELVKRVDEGTLKPRHWRVLFDRAQLKSDSPWPMVIEMPERWLIGKEFQIHTAPSPNTPFWARSLRTGATFTAVSSEEFKVRTSQLRSPGNLRAYGSLVGPPGTIVNLGWSIFTVEATAVGRRQLAVEVEVRRPLPGAAWLRWEEEEPRSAVWRGQVRKTILIGNTIDDVMTPVRNEALAASLAQSVRVVPYTSFNVLEIAGLTRPGDGDIAIGGVAELYRGGILYGRAQLWIDKNNRVYMIEGDLGNADRIRRNHAEAMAAKWTLRFTSGPEAIYDGRAPRYWQGEIEVDLRPRADGLPGLLPVGMLLETGALREEGEPAPAEGSSP